VVAKIATSLTISPSPLSVSPGETKSLIATLSRVRDGVTIAGKTITWNTTVGTILPTSGTTDSQGRVTFNFTAPSSVGSGVIQFSFAGDNTYKENSATINCRVGLNPTSLAISPSAYSVYSGETVDVTVTLTSDGNPVAYKIISLSTSTGTLSSASSATDSNGRVSITYTAPTQQTSATITATFAGDSQYSASSNNVSITVLFRTFLVLKKPDNNPLANTTIYYGTSQGKETDVLGTTDPQGEVAITNPSLVGQKIYLKSSDNKYVGSVIVSESESVTTQVTEVSEFPLLPVAVLVCGIACAAVVVWKVLSKPKHKIILKPKRR